MACCSTEMCNKNSVDIIKNEINKVTTTTATIIENLTSVMNSATKPTEASAPSSCKSHFKLIFAIFHLRYHNHLLLPHNALCVLMVASLTLFHSLFISPLIAASDDVFECEEAYEITFDHVSSGTWNSSKCRRDLGQRCIRGEGTLEFSGLSKGALKLINLLAEKHCGAYCFRGSKLLASPCHFRRNTRKLRLPM